MAETKYAAEPSRRVNDAFKGAPTHSPLGDFIENAVVGVFRSSDDGHLVAANKALAEMFGFESLEDLLSSVVDISRQIYVNPADRERFRSLLKEHRNISGFEVKMFRKDQSIMDASIDARAFQSEDGAVFYEGIIADISDRVAAQTALKTSEENWRSLVENSGDVIIIVDREGVVSFINRSSEESGHMTAGCSIYDHMPPESVAKLQSIIQDVFQNGEPRGFELNEHAGGRLSGWYETRAVPVRTGNDVTGVILICTEITERKRTEDELRESQRFIERVADTSPDVLYVYDLINRTYVYANHQVWRVLGITVEELRSMGSRYLEEFTHPDDAELLNARSRILTTATGNDVFECEYRVRHSNGQWRWLNSRDTIFTRTPDGRPHQILGTARDITDRKQTRDALRESEERLRVLVETTAVVPWEADFASGRYTYVGPQAEALLGFTPSEWCSENFWIEHVHPSDREWAAAYRKEAAEGSQGFELEYQMLSSDGRTLWVKDIVHPRIGSGASSRIGGFIIDITNRRRVEDELQKSHEQLRALAAKGQNVREEERIRIAREIHDELGQELTALKIDLRWLENQAGPSSGEFTEKMAAMYSAIDGTIDTVRRIATELRPPVLDHLGLADAVEWQGEEFEKRFGIPCEVSVEEDASIENPDLATAVFRIFQEILTNVARHAKASRIKVSLGLESGQLVLKVEDDGIGLSRNDTKASLGLLGMRERAHIYGGEVTFRGTPSKGTVVTLTIPRAALAPPDISDVGDQRLQATDLTKTRSKRTRSSETKSRR